MEATIKDRGEFTRTKSTDGFLYGKAAITKSGIVDYTEKELGISDSEAVVKVLRTNDTVFDPETLSSIRACPITIGHPKDFVKPTTWKEHVVGNTIGEPSILDTNRVGTDIMIGDADAIKSIENGLSELSIGYTFSFEAVDKGLEFDYQSVGPLDINHVAVVKRGRSGSDVRLFDSRLTTFQEKQMTEAEIKEMVAKAIKDAVPTKEGIDTDKIADSVAKSIAPIAAKVEALAKDQASRDAKANLADAEAKAKKAADLLVAETVKIERERAIIVADAMPMVPEKDRDTLKNAEVKDILVAAIGDSVKVDKDASIDYLKGVFDSLKDARENSTLITGPSVTDGVGTKTKAYNDYIEFLAAGKVQETK